MGLVPVMHDHKKAKMLKFVSWYFVLIDNNNNMKPRAAQITNNQKNKPVPMASEVYEVRS